MLLTALAVDERLQAELVAQEKQNCTETWVGRRRLRMLMTKASCHRTGLAGNNGFRRAVLLKESRLRDSDLPLEMAVVEEDLVGRACSCEVCNAAHLEEINKRLNGSNQNKSV